MSTLKRQSDRRIAVAKQTSKALDRRETSTPNSEKPKGELLEKLAKAGDALTVLNKRIEK